MLVEVLYLLADALDSAGHESVVEMSAGIVRMPVIADVHPLHVSSSENV